MEEISSVAVNEATSQETPSQETPSQETTNKPIYSRKRNIKCLESLVNKVRAVGEMVQTPIANDNEFGIFGRSVAAQLNAMPLMLALQAQSHIQNYLTTLRVNSLANPHQQVFSPSSPSPLSDTIYISSPAPTINSSISGGVSDTNPTENLELYSPPTASPASPATYHVL